MTICHATGSETNPFVQITVAVSALAAHTRHQHGEDVVGATEPCAATTTPAAAPMTAPGSAAPGSAVAGAAAPGSPADGGARVPALVREPAAAGGVGGVNASSGDRPVAAAGTGESRRDSAAARDESLPFTGFAVIALALAGAGALAGGSRLRRSAGRTG